MIWCPPYLRTVWFVLMLESRFLVLFLLAMGHPDALKQMIFVQPLLVSQSKLRITFGARGIFPSHVLIHRSPVLGICKKDKFH